MIFNSKDGGMPMVTLILCLMIMSIAGIGFIYAVAKLDARVANVNNDTVNLSGINYYSEQYNMTNVTMHQITGEVIPNYIYVVIAFVVIIICMIVIATLKH